MNQPINLHGAPLAQAIRRQVSSDVATFTKAGVIRPRMAVVLASEEPSAYSYVDLTKSAERLGIQLDVIEFPPATNQEHLESVLDDLSTDPEVHGIVLEFPLAAHLDGDSALTHVAPYKDVDGLTPTNLGLVAAGHEDRALIGATPQACIELAELAGPLEGRRVGLVGRGRTVGRPLIPMLINRHATVTVCHTRTPDLADALYGCEIVIVAIGQAGAITADHLHEGQIIIDAGLNEVDEQLCGDVATSAAEKVAALSPVPGGIGPLASSIIFRNLLTAIRLQLSSGDLAW